ncbi:MAG: sigma-70 family RNA polymerase sigma factor [Planctomycetes bacterium]|nr:sigma-70 family RNA polymerase sigma factor [Planctomycetota bacterium]
MSATSTFPSHFLRDGSLDWEFIRRAFRSEERFRIVVGPLEDHLVGGSTAFLPEASTPAFLERGESPRAQIPGDPLSVYWADLRRLRPTNREEEFLLARCVTLLRRVLLRLLNENPRKSAIAIAQEHLSPYSEVLSDLKDAGVKGDDQDLDAGLRDLLHLRLAELRAVQNALVDRNLHLVPTVANRYRHVGVPWEDLIQEGNTALLRAVERYNRFEGARFSSYATWWIQQGILHALSFQSRTVRLPVYLAQALHRVRDAVASSPEHLETPELAERTRLSSERVERALGADRTCLSIDRSPDGEDGEDSFREFLADQRELPLPDEPNHSELRNTLEDLLNRLPSREALVLRLRFGLEDGRPWTLEQVRSLLGVSRERVRQLQAQSLRRLSQPTPRRTLSRFA